MEDLAGGVNGIVVPSDAERTTTDAGKKEELDAEELVPRVIGGSDTLEHEGEVESVPSFLEAGAAPTWLAMRSAPPLLRPRLSSPATLPR
jgi:hypothetical protein